MTGREHVTHRLRRPRRRDERGTASAFVVGIAVVLLAVAGLVADGGAALNARMKLADDVEQAARAGALEIDETALRGPQGTVTLDRTRAQQSAAAYISRFGYTNAGVAVDDDSVTVGATDTVETVFLSLVGFDRFDLDATATAEAVTQ